MLINLCKFNILRMSASFINNWTSINKTFDFILKYGKDSTDEVIIAGFRTCYDLHDLRVSVMHEELFKMDPQVEHAGKLKHLTRALENEERAMIKLTTAARDYADKAKDLLVEDLENDISNCNINKKEDKTD